MSSETDPNSPETSVIRLSREYQVADLCYALGCSEEDLRKAAKMAGPHQEDVRRLLGSGV